MPEERKIITDSKRLDKIITLLESMSAKIEAAIKDRR